MGALRPVPTPARLGLGRLILAAALLGPRPALADTDTSSVAAPPPPVAAPAPDDDPELAALRLAAEALGLLAAGELGPARLRLETAVALAPDDPGLLRDLALVHAQAGRPEAAAALLARARAAGDRSAEGAQLAAILAASAADLALVPRTPAVAAAASREEDGPAARAAVEDRDDWASDLVAASLGDGSATARLVRVADGPDRRGAITALALAARAAATEQPTVALALADTAERTATALGLIPVITAARELAARAAGARAWAFGARLRTSIDYATNPRLTPEGAGPTVGGLRWAARAEAAVRGPVGPARLDVAAAIDQQLHLVRRDRLAELDLTGLAASLRLELPLVDRPRAARIGAALRLRDLYGDRMRLHYALSVEAGPTLWLPLGPRGGLELALTTVATDHVDRSPADDVVSAANRDRFGQRALAAYGWSTDGLRGRVELGFLRDDAKGDAFDAVGGLTGAWLEADLGGGATLATSAAVTLRRYGPVGDPRVLGSAAQRTDVRFALQATARVPLDPTFAAVFQDSFVRTSARAGHEYSDNQLSLGLEARW